MSATTINLLPPTRRAMLRARRRAAVWSRVVGATAALVGGVSGLLRDGADPGLMASVAQERAAMEGVRARRGALSRERAEVERALAADRVLGRSPDWEPLVRGIVGRLGEGVVLERMSVERVVDGGVVRHDVAISCLAREQAEALALASRLEEMGVFRSVRLLDSARRRTVAGELVAFRVRGILRGSE